MITEVTDNNFDKLIGESDLAILEFGAAWCPPCKRQLPVLESLAAEYPKLVVAKLDVDESPKLTNIYDVISVPTLIAFKDGIEYTRHTGAVPKAKILRMLNL